MTSADPAHYQPPQDKHFVLRGVHRDSLEALQLLICDMLRSSHFQMMNEDQMRIYTYQAGVALHNIPINIANGQILHTSQLINIDRLDPSSTSYKWGEWISRYAAKTNQVLPDKESLPPANVHLPYEGNEKKSAIQTLNNIYTKLLKLSRDSFARLVNR